MLSIAELPKYESYKDSKSDYSGEIPSKWGLVPIRAIFDERNEKNSGPKTDHILSVTKDRGVIPYDEKGALGNNKSDDIERYKLVYENDLVINKMNVVIGSLGLSKYFGALSQVYIVLRPKSEKFSIRYYAYLFHNEPFYKSLIRYCTGIMALRESLDKDQFKQLYLPFPVFEDQVLIAKFLDKKTTQIDEAIAIKEQQIALLKERKQIIIQKAVTQGLDPNMPMKDSGVDWIGKIPAHWEVVPNKKIFSLKKNLVGKKSAKYELLSLTLRGVIKRDMDNPEGKFPADFDTYQEVREGDFVFCLFDVEETPRAVGLSSHDGMITGAYTVFGADPAVSKEFLYLFYLNLDSRKMMRPLYKGLRNTIPKDAFLSFKTPLPSLGEQKEIVQFVEIEIRRTEQGITHMSEQIDKLKEYKTTLINSAVTGKIRITPDMVEA